MIDLGKRQEVSKVVPSSESKKIYYPSFYIDKEIPLDDKDIGKEVMGLCRLKLTSISKRTNENENKYSCSFDVMGIEFKKGHYKK